MIIAIILVLIVVFFLTPLSQSWMTTATNSTGFLGMALSSPSDAWLLLLFKSLPFILMVVAIILLVRKLSGHDQEPK
jgi:hypothetical protein